MRFRLQFFLGREVSFAVLSRAESIVTKLIGVEVWLVWFGLLFFLERKFEFSEIGMAARGISFAVLCYRS